jgi:hypothetical protein
MRNASTPGKSPQYIPHHSEESRKVLYQHLPMYARIGDSEISSFIFVFNCSGSRPPLLKKMIRKQSQRHRRKNEFATDPNGWNKRKPAADNGKQFKP